MQKTACFNLLYCRSAAWLLAVFGVACLTALAQNSPEADKSTATTDFLTQAAKSYGLNDRDQQPWRMRVRFQRFDTSGNVVDRGSYEELRVNRFRYRLGFESSFFTQTEYGTENGILRTGKRTSPPPPLSLLRTAIVRPIADAEIISRFARNSESSFIKVQQREVDGTNLRCFDLILLRAPAPSAPSYCFDDSDALVQFPVGFPGMGEATWKDTIDFRGRHLPRDLVIKWAGVAVLSTHIESIEDLTAADEAELQAPADAGPPEASIFGIAGIEGSIPPPGAPGIHGAMPKKVNISAGVAAANLVARVEPIYPPIAKAARVQGTVVLQALLGKDGQVEELRVVSGPAMLQQGALDAVKQWTYRPYLLNGEPVEVLTTVNVIFTLTP
jgi:TonB family protein